ncbi:MAG: hypothetical protein P1P86_09330 [Bacteroidales bacterium]|nr:hypothetical protein [Bacteroidales bacterium]
MKYFYILLAAAGLLLLLIPAILFYFDVLEAEQMKNYMFIGTLLWFSGAIPWLGKKTSKNDE